MSGVLAFLGYAGFDQVALSWICLVPLLWAIGRETPKRAFLLGWVAGIVGHAGGFYWIATTLREFADAPWPLAMGGVLLLAAANGLGFALWAWGTRLVTGRLGWSLLWVSPAVWTGVEKLWPQLFPNYFGASQYRLTLVTQVADVTGILGLSFLVIFINTAVFAVIEGFLRREPPVWRPAALLAAVLAAVLGYGAVRIHMVDDAAAAAETIAVGLVQTNRGAGDKHADQRLFLQEHVDLSRELERKERPDLLVWPESVLGLALPAHEGTLSPALLGGLRTPLLFGTIIQLHEGGERRLYNSAVLTDAGGRIRGTYDKMVLVPFGEYVPFGDVFPQLYAWSPYTGQFRPGTNREPLMLNGAPLSVNICYENIFPGQVRMLMQGGEDRRVPQVLFNLTNDSWYGDTVQPREHLALASFRSIEHRRALVRATNTGISAIVDPAGRIVRRTGQWTKETLSGRVPLMQGRTVYGMLGDWLGWLCGAITLYGVVRARRALEGGKGGKKRR
jgi:apolipoprotein N-acyltransferase